MRQSRRSGPSPGSRPPAPPGSPSPAPPADGAFAMAGSQDPNENPVAINVVPMVDVIFCLCVFFMCSFKFKQIEGKFDSWLPKDKGIENAANLPSVIEEIRIAMYYDDKSQTTFRQYM